MCVCLSIYLSVCLSVYLSVCLWVCACVGVWACGCVGVCVCLCGWVGGGVEGNADAAQACYLKLGDFHKCVEACTAALDFGAHTKANTVTEF